MVLSQTLGNAAEGTVPRSSVVQDSPVIRAVGNQLIIRLFPQRRIGIFFGFVLPFRGPFSLGIKIGFLSLSVQNRRRNGVVRLHLMSGFFRSFMVNPSFNRSIDPFRIFWVSGFRSARTDSDMTRVIFIMPKILRAIWGPCLHKPFGFVSSREAAATRDNLQICPSLASQQHFNVLLAPVSWCSSDAKHFWSRGVWDIALLSPYQTNVRVPSLAKGHG